jgi:hypothetical protein
MLVGWRRNRTQLLKQTPKDDSGQRWFKLARYFHRLYINDHLYELWLINPTAVKHGCQRYKK